MMSLETDRGSTAGAEERAKKRNKFIFIGILLLFVMLTILYGLETKKNKEYYTLNIGECSIEVSSERRVAVTKDNNMLFGSVKHNNVFTVYWKKDALKYLKHDLIKHEYKIKKLGNLNMINIKKLNIKVLVGKNFYITFSNITKDIQNRVIQKCNQTLETEFTFLDIDEILKYYPLDDDEVKILKKINTSMK